MNSGEPYILVKNYSYFKQPYTPDSILVTYNHIYQTPNITIDTCFYADEPHANIYIISTRSYDDLASLREKKFFGTDGILMEHFKQWEYNIGKDSIKVYITQDLITQKIDTSIIRFKTMKSDERGNPTHILQYIDNSDTPDAIFHYQYQYR